MKGRLNLFQRTMLRWRALHPYNAVHVLRIEAPLDVARLRAAIARTLEGEGLTGLHLDAARGRYEYAGGPAPLSLALLLVAVPVHAQDADHSVSFDGFGFTFSEELGSSVNVSTLIGDDPAGGQAIGDQAPLSEPA